MDVTRGRVDSRRRVASEFELIEAFIAPFRPLRSPRGPGDDAAVLPPSRGLTEVVTTDSVVEGVHFTRKTFSFAQVGTKSLAVNLSDLAAMGAKPQWGLCSLFLPPGFSKRDVVALGRGAAAVARTYGLTLAGGNISRAPMLAVTWTVGGFCRRPLLRSGARPGDLIYVGKALGDAYGGYHALTAPALRLTRSADQSLTHSPADSTDWLSRTMIPPKRLLDAQRTPIPQVRLGLIAARFASAAIDISDGLLQDLSHLCHSSGVGASLEAASIPLSRDLKRFAGPRALEWALRGGEDYALLVTVPPRKVHAFERSCAAAKQPLFRVGRTTKLHGLDLDGERIRGPGGFLHFTPKRAVSRL